MALRNEHRIKSALEMPCDTSTVLYLIYMDIIMIRNSKKIKFKKIVFFVKKEYIRYCSRF